MIGFLFFDWDGPRDTVKEYGKILKEACEKTGVKFHGLYNPPQDKWNFVAAVEAENEVEMRKAFGEAGGMAPSTGARMTHAIWKYYRLISLE